MPSGKTEKKDGLHRLTDMEVEEVSFVDRGANLKRFLVVKRDVEGDAMGELTSDGRGGFTRTRTMKAAKEEPAEEGKDKKKKPLFGGNQAPPFQAKKPKTAAEGDDEEEDDEDEDEEEEDASKAAGKKPEDEEEDDEDEAKKVRKAQSVEGLKDCIEQLMEVAEQLKDSDDGALDDDMKKSLGEVSDKLGKLSGKAEGGVEKAGRRMSKERLDRFEKVVAEIAGILKELKLSPELKDTEKRHSALLKLLAKAFSGDSNPQVEELSNLVQELTTEVTKLRKDNVLLKKGAGSGGSNSTQVEKSERDRREGGVEWPHDMNNPMTRETTSKDISFYDD
jgi:hypothetical protein